MEAENLQLDPTGTHPVSFAELQLPKPYEQGETPF
jgi:hypothetical protein